MAPAHLNMKEPGKVINKWLPRGQGTNNAHWRDWSPSVRRTTARMAENGNSWARRNQGVTEFPDINAPHLNPQLLKLNNSKRSWGWANLVCISIPSLPMCVLGHIAQLPKSQFFSCEKWGYYDVPLRAIVKIKHRYMQAPSTVSGTNQELRGKSLLLSTLEKCI